MKIHRFDVRGDQEWVLPVNREDIEVLTSLDGIPRLAQWRPIPVHILKEDEGKRFAYSDFPWFGRGVPILRRPAVEAVGDLLTEYGELLPLECDDAELLAFNTCMVVDALDVDRSVVVVGPTTGKIITVEMFAFKEESLSGVQVFKVPQLLLGPVFVDQGLVDFVRAAGLKRVDFRLLWESPQT
jgi:hypothetical protein